MKKLILLSTVTAMSLFALEFVPLGYKSIGMGGAGVANASGSAAAYYNPALLSKTRYTVEVSLGAGIGGREINLIDPLDKLVNTYDLEGSLDTVADHAPINGSNDEETKDNIKGALNEIYKLSEGNGLTIEPTAEFSFQVGRFALGVYGLGDLTATAVIDRQHMYLIVKDDKTNGYYYYNPYEDTYSSVSREDYENYSLEYAIDNGLTNVTVDGLGIIEVPISYAMDFDVKGAVVSLGMNLKYMQGTTYKNVLSIENTDSDKLEDSLSDNSKTSTSMGVDLGMLVRAGDFRFGIVGKYLNSPEFDYYDGTKYKIKPMVRGGVAVDLTNWLTFAMDIDLTENNTGIKDYKSQYIGGGINIHRSWLSIRAGAMRNLVQDEEGIILTAGLGFGLKWFQLDVAAEAATKKGTYDGNDIPRYMKLNVALISRWGGN